MEVAHSPSPAPSQSGIKKVFSKATRSRTSVNEVDHNSSGSHRGPRTSIDLGREKLKARNSGESSRGDESSRSGSSGMRKLVPGHKRRRRKRDGQADEEAPRGRSTETSPTIVTQNLELNASQSTFDNDDGRSLLTEDSDLDSPRPPLMTRDSHAGYITASSPLIHASTIPQINVKAQLDETDPDTEETRPQTATTLPSSESAPAIDTTTALRHANTLGAPEDVSRLRRKSIGSGFRGISPGTRIKEVFKPSKADKSSNISPDRESTKSSTSGTSGNGGLSGNGGKTKSNSWKASWASEEPPPPLPKSIWIEQNKKSFGNSSVPPIITTPKTPPNSGLTAPLTTVTPPTPTLEQRPVSKPSSPKKDIPSISAPDSAPTGTGETTVSPSGNMISHRRARSTSAVNPPSKLSNSISSPLTPTIEEKTPGPRTASGAGGFFSSVFSAAQNAASTLSSSLNQQQRNRSGTQTSEPDKDKPKLAESSVEESSAPTSDAEPPEQKKLAVETLGMGDLNFSHLGIETLTASPQKEGKASSVKSADLTNGKEASMKKDEVTAQAESARAARAVSAAYDAKPLEGFPTPIAEDIPSERRPRSTFGALGGEQTPPNGSVFEADIGTGPKRSNSVRSKMGRRRHRGSSGATTATTIGAMVGASTSVLANPAAQISQPRLTGFAVASKKRNRDFHQLFRSVPEDDYLIEDYSCALQREILLAGRIYISEGHICFSSNILGWVTTLVISFDEVMSVEKENTAVVFPNAIAIQTLHARHTFRSLLSRESTYDLLINIWKISHPSLISSANGSRLDGPGTGDKTEKTEDSDAGSDLSSEEEDEVYDEDEEDGDMRSFTEAGDGSVAGSEPAEPTVKAISRKASAAVGANGVAAAPPYPQFSGDVKGGEKAGTAGAEASADFPGPSVHAPTECADGASHYEKVVKDESVPAPLGKIYSMMFGPASGVFLKTYLLEDQKVMDLQFEDDKKGLGPGTETRSYSYIKPLNTTIRPKQTKCLTTEALDAFDLDKAVSVTVTTQTPDVPSGNVFSVKTKYCLSWAPGNATRIQMNCAIEWTGKSWLKGPIEKGANDGQQSYGNDLIKALKAGVTSRPRTATAGSKASAGVPGKTKKRRKGDGSRAANDGGVAVAAAKARKEQEESWGLFEPLREILGLVVSLVAPLVTMQVVVGILTFLVVWLWWRGPSSAALARHGGYPALTSMPDRMTAYEDMWRREESELWDWLEQRVGMGDGMGYPTMDVSDEQVHRAKKARAKALGKKGDVEAKVREEKMNEREMEDAIRVTQERLDLLRGVVEKKKERRERSEGGG